ncbi:MAG: hypothetical protein ACYSWP_12400 [Planctomycetota bacterium]|jgi:hypothetical protein
MDPNVAWFDVDLSEHNIIINSGSFYIGWRHLEVTQKNQVGFDMEGNPYVPHTRSWGYTPGSGWFNLDNYCQLCYLLPIYCEFCGNLMIRAEIGEPQIYSGQLPDTIGPAILYSGDDNPKPCPDSDLEADEYCQVTLPVYAVGPVGEYTKFHAVSSNNYSMDSSGPIKVTITAPISPCDAANLDGILPIDGGDLDVLASQWLQNPELLIADLNGDLSINFEDFALLAMYWLEGCN